MKAIKFRAWDKDQKLYFVNAQASAGFLFREFLNNPRFVVEQFTGIYDKNSKEIYEGDEIYFSQSKSQHYKGHVSWSDKYLCYLVYCYWQKQDEIPHLCDGFEMRFKYENTCVRRLTSDCFDIEVIGSIQSGQLSRLMKWRVAKRKSEIGNESCVTTNT